MMSFLPQIHVDKLLDSKSVYNRIEKNIENEEISAKFLNLVSVLFIVGQLLIHVKTTSNTLRHRFHDRFNQERDPTREACLFVTET